MTIFHLKFEEVTNFYLLSIKEPNSHPILIFIYEFCLNFLEIIVLPFY